MVQEWLEKFQSTRPHGARPRRKAFFAKLQQFQSTRPHGARLIVLKSLPFNNSFNPRARTGRDAI